jgi:hypothetical protein
MPTRGRDRGSSASFEYEVELAGDFGDPQPGTSRKPVVKCMRSSAPEVGVDSLRAHSHVPEGIVW